MKDVDNLFRDITSVIFDFDGVFTDNKVYVDEQGIESVCCSRADGLGLQKLDFLGIRALILSTEVNQVVSIRANKMNVECLQAVKDKKEALLRWAAKNKLPLYNMCFVGNDINDIPAFKIVGLPVAVLDAYQDVLPYVKYKTKRPGGYGAVREICDLIFTAHTTSKNKGVNIE